MELRPENLLNISLENRRGIIGKLTLFQLNTCYNYYNKALITLNTFVNEQYNDNVHDKLNITYMEMDYNKCMKTIKNYEQLLNLIHEELETRNVSKRFFK